MRRILVPVALALLCIVFVQSDGQSADTAEVHNLSGNVIFTEDVTYGDHSLVTIDDGTVIDMFTFRWNIGSDSLVRISGRVTVMSYQGSIVLGSGSSVVMFGTALLGLDHDLTCSFAGLLVFQGHPSDTEPAMDFRPIGDDHRIRFAWEGQTLSVADLKMYQTLSSGGYERVFDLSGIELSKTFTEGGQTVSTRCIAAEVDDPHRAIVASVDTTSKTADITVDLGSATVTDRYPESDTTSVLAIEGIGRATVAVGADMFGRISFAASGVSLVKTVAGEVKSSISASGVSFAGEIDLVKFIQLIIGGIEGDTPDFIRGLDISAGKASITDNVYGAGKELTDLSLTVDSGRDPDRYIAVSAKDGESVLSTYSAKPVVTGYQLSQDFILDMECTVPSVSFNVLVGNTSSTADLRDVTLNTERLDLKSLYLLYIRTGSLAIEHLLDNSRGFSLGTASLAVDENGDGEYETLAYGLSAVLVKDARDVDTLTLTVGSLLSYITLNGVRQQIETNETRIYMEAVGNVQEIIDAFLHNSHFTDNAHAELSIANQGFAVRYPLPDGNVLISGRRTSEISPVSATLSISMDHSVEKARTVLSGRLSSAGFALCVGIQRSYADPSGELRALLTATDMSGSFDMTLGAGITYSAKASMPFEFQLYYYGIDLRGGIGESTIGVNRGILSVDGFDTSAHGIQELPFFMLTGNYRTEFRLSSEFSDIVIYNQSEEYASYSDVSVESRRITVDMDRQCTAGVDLYDLRLDVLRTDGSTIGRSLDHLRLNLDIGEEPGEKSLADRILPVLIIPCIVISLGMVLFILRLKKQAPELLRFNELDYMDYGGSDFDGFK